MNNSQADAERQLLLSLKTLGKSLKESVTLLCRIKKIPFKAITDSAGYIRNALYQALTGPRIPKKPLYESVVKHLKTDTWAVYGITQSSTGYSIT